MITRDKYQNFLRTRYLRMPENETPLMEEWRDRFFIAMITWAIPIALIIIGPSIYRSVVDGYPVVALIDIIVITAFMGIIFNRTLTLKVKRYLFLVCLYFLSLSLFYYMGLKGPGLVFMLSMSVFATLLIHGMAGYFSLILNYGAFLAIGLLIHIPNPEIYHYPHSKASWVTLGINLLAINTAVVVALISMIRGLLESSRKQARLSVELHEEKEELKREIQQRMKKEIEVQESEVKYRALTESATDAIITFDDKAIINSWNFSAERIFGYSPDEIIGKPITTIIPALFETEQTQTEFSPDMVVDLLGRLTEIKAYRRDSSELPIEVSLSTWNVSNDQFFTIILRDITNKKKREKIAKSLTANLQAINRLSLKMVEALNLENLYGTIFEYVSKTMSCSSFLISTYNASEDLIIADYVIDNGTEIDTTQLPPIPLNRSGQGKQSQVILTGEPIYVPDWFATLNKHVTQYSIEDDGKVFAGPPDKDHEGNFTHSGILCPMKFRGQVVGVMQVQSKRLDDFSAEDIDHLKALANMAAVAIQNIKLVNNLTIALEDAHKAIDVKTKFLANISHEIRTPMNAISGFTELLSEHELIQKDDELHTYGDFIMSSVNRLLRTMDEILTISQLMANAYTLYRNPLDIGRVVGSIFEKNRSKAVMKNLQFQFANGAENTMIIGDIYSLEAAVNNLVENAIKFTDAGRIDISLRNSDDHLILEISDTGIGMSAEYLAELFSVFSQESTGFTKKYQGIGLGMAITKRFLDLNNVTIDVKSVLKSGTTFALTFLSIPNNA